jgi:hypothetical protein
MLWNEHASFIRQRRADETQRREIEYETWRMKFDYKIFGDKPSTGRSLFISLHGGGNAPARVNDRQWENQKKLYEPSEGIYLAPRAPTDTWNLWHQAHIDPLFQRLIEDLIVLEDVNPNRVYVLGYSAGGDGVYQLAPRFADRLAAAAIMAGHPNEASPLGLRNLPFALHVGANDGAYNRNQVAADWGKQLQELQQADPAGYVHDVQIHADKGHWMDRADAVAVPWMARFNRNPLPDKIIWRQDDVTHRRFYWLAVPDEPLSAGATVRATRIDQQIDLQTEGIAQLAVRLNDAMADLDREIVVRANGHVAFQGQLPRTIACLAKTLGERGDPASVFCSEAVVTIPATIPTP